MDAAECMKTKPKKKFLGVSAEAPERGSHPGGVDLDAVERVLEFMNQHGLEEFEYANGPLHIRLKKPSSVSGYLPRSTAFPEIVVANSAPASAPVIERIGARELETGEDLHIIKSPIVGTFYEAPSPDAEPFVKVGDRVAVIAP